MGAFNNNSSYGVDAASLTESPYVQQFDFGMSFVPPVPDDFLLLDGTDFLLLEGGNFELL